MQKLSLKNHCCGLLKRNTQSDLNYVWKDNKIIHFQKHSEYCFAKIHLGSGVVTQKEYLAMSFLEKSIYSIINNCFYSETISSVIHKYTLSFLVNPRRYLLMKKRSVVNAFLCSNKVLTILIRQI
jgi:hypothetical protein